MKTEFLSIAYRNLAPTAGNRLTETLMNLGGYGKPIYLKRLEITRGAVYDTTFTERTVTGLGIYVVSSDSGWNTRPFSGTLGANSLYNGNGYGIHLDPKNCPAVIELGDIYVPATGTVTINMELYCPGIVITDVVNVYARLAFEYEQTMNYSVAEFDISQ